MIMKEKLEKMATTVQSRKSKGRRLQQAVVKKILEAFPQLSPRDVQSRSMGSAGEDIILSEAAFQLLPCSFEAKNKETNKGLLKDWEQTCTNASGAHPVLVLSANRSPTLAVIELDLLLLLYKERINEQSKV